MKLCELLRGILKLENDYFSKYDITAVTDHSEKCRKGSLFVAVKGNEKNGNQYIENAYKNGARVFISEERKNTAKDALLLVCDDARKILALLSARINGNPEKEMSFIGITGTKGKTTSAVLLYEILKKEGIKCVCIGTLGVMGIPYPKPRNTTPSACELFDILKTARSAGASIAVIELSSQALKDKRAYGIKFKTVGFTGISNDHIGKGEHESFSEYLSAKRLLFSSYGAECAVVNSDDMYSSYISYGVDKIIKFGFNCGADYKISSFLDDKNGSAFAVGSTLVRTRLPGLYNAKNAALALIIASEFTGKEHAALAGHLDGVIVPGRFDFRFVMGRNVVIDYAHNMQSFAEISTLARRMFGGKIIGVFGSVGERSFARRSELAEVANELMDFAVITSDNSAGELPIKICAEIYSAFLNKEKARVITDRKEAIIYAVTECASGGDTVLLLGKGHENVISENGKRKYFSEKKVLDYISENFY